jgi:hypothetical protein
MNIKYRNIKTVSEEWTKVSVPCVVIKHRVLKTDPTYKFVINANIYMRSNVAIKSNNGSKYYDLLNILAPSSGVITGSQWLNLLQDNYNITLSDGHNYISSIFPNFGFETVEDRDLFDTLYTNLSDSQFSDGLNLLIDFSLQSSGGFVRNKMDIDTSTIDSNLLNDLSLNLLSKITTKESNNNLRINPSYKISLNLSSAEIRYIEFLLNYTNTLMPKNEDGVPYIWNYVNQLSTLPLSGKQHLFGFLFNKISITNITNNDFNLSVDKNNFPLNVTVKNGSYDKNNQIIRV